MAVAKTNKKNLISLKKEASQLRKEIKRAQALNKYLKSDQFQKELDQRVEKCIDEFVERACKKF